MNTSLRTLGIALALSILPATAVHAQVSVGIQIGLPGVQIGVNMPSYPTLVAVPGYPVYYDPQASANYFFYDGLYWVYTDDNWYASSWYNGPWELTSRDYVPLFVLRIPVRYYRHPPSYFSGWRADAPPRWDEHWGRDWERRRPGWDRWDRRQVPAAAPLPRYQQKYPSDRYPTAVERQREILRDNYRHVPRELIERPKQGFAVPLDQWLRGLGVECHERLHAGLRADTRLGAHGYRPTHRRRSGLRHAQPSTSSLSCCRRHISA